MPLVHTTHMINTYIKNITVQNYGISLLLFIEGQTEQEAYDIWLSLFNWGATGTLESKPSYISEGVLSCWTTEEKLRGYLVRRYINHLHDTAPKKGVEGGVIEEARKLAAADYAALKTETYRSSGANYDTYAMGVITAEKLDEDFKDSVLTYAFSDRS